LSVARTFSERLQEAQGDPQKLALVTLDIVLESSEPWMRDVVEAAAVPHWFTAGILGALVQVDPDTAGRYLQALTRLPMVETFAARNGWNVHEMSRLALRASGTSAPGTLPNIVRASG
jgi:hypothetical protein